MTNFFRKSKSLVLIVGNPFCRIVAAMAFLVVASGYVYPQDRMTDGSTPPTLALGPSLGGGGDFGTISAYNGRMNYTLPLARISGRGEAGYAISLPINRQWIYERRSHVTVGESVYYYSVPVADVPWHSENLRYMPGKFFGRSTQQAEEPLCHQGQSSNSVNAHTRLSLVSSDGSEITLVSRESGDTALPVSILCDSSGQATSITPSERGTEFVSDDGSRTRFISDETITDSNFLGGYFKPSGTLYFPNGVKYRIDEGFITQIKDRNGNLTSFSYDGAQYDSKLIQITDSNGRTTTISYNDYHSTYGIHDQILAPGFDGGTQTTRISYSEQGDALRSGETLKTKDELFGEECPPELSNCPDPSPVNMTVISSVWLPDNRRFRFRYNSYAELARVETPTGSAFEYDWGGALDGGPSTGVVQYFPNPPHIFRQVLEKRTYPNGGTGSSYQLKTNFSKSASQAYSTSPLSARTISTSNNQNQLLAREIHKFYGNPVPPIGGMYDYYRNGASLEGHEYETRYFGSDNSLLRRELKEWVPVQFSGLLADFRSTSNIIIGFENGAALATLGTTEYDGGESSDPDHFAHLNPKRSKSYRPKVISLSTAESEGIEGIEALFSSGDVISISETDYLYDRDYGSRGLQGLRTESRVINPTNPNDVFARSQFMYDETDYLDDKYSATGWEDPESTLRGNVTTNRTWNQDSSTWIESHTMFDNFGNVRKVWDTSGDVTRFIETEYDSAYEHAYPTRTIAPAPDPSGQYGTSESSEISRTYDFNTGLVLSVTDANGQTATMEYVDPLYRPTKIIPPAGAGISEIIYNDTPGNIWVKRRQQIDEQNWAESTTFYDGLGRTVKSRTKDLQGDVMTAIGFDSFGRVEKTSNPYRVDSVGDPTETVYWSKVRYDTANRVVETYAPAPSGQTGNTLGTVEFGISSITNLVGTYATATDASGRKSRAISGIYGLMRVDEATGIAGTAEQDLGTLSNPHQPTSYSYNLKGELVKITQGKSGQPTQYRYFAYDSLGRLVRVCQPEQTPNAYLATTGNPDNNSWTAGYAYDVFGNVISMTDAKNTTITNQYDKAGRTVKRTYSDNTPQVEYFYDGKGLPSVPQFSKGSLTKVTSSVSEDRFTAFDNHGRLLISHQITDGQTYTFGYEYNLSGGLIEQTYPSGRIVRNYLDMDGGLSEVTTKAVGGLNRVMALNFDYSATGAVRKMQLGNGLWETAQFDERQQLTQVGLGTTQTNNDLFKVDYEYGELQTNGTVDATKNIGNIGKTTTTIPTTNFVQTFKYDAINRLKEATEKTGSTTNWQQVFDYDRFGNRTQFAETVNGNPTQNTPINHPSINTADNRFTTGQGYTYDYNGNIVQDAEGRTFTFNGDDKQTEVRNTATSEVIGQYFYDGSGARVKKVVPSTGEVTLFVYDAGGALAAEYSTVEAPEEPTTSYLTTDHLGSPRIITDAEGDVISRRDFMPFGEELHAGIGPRTENLKYSIAGVDNVRKRFTGYEKDDETGLDFAEARMYQNKHGRFTAPDPLLASASAANPQTFNRYVYTGNNPVNLTDPSGLKWCRNNTSTEVKFTGVGVGCEKGWDVIDGSVGRAANSGCHVGVTTSCYSAGAVIRYHRNGTTSLVSGHQLDPSDPADAAQISRMTGTNVSAAQEEVSMESTTGSVSSDIQLVPLLPFPCRSEDSLQCNNSAPLPSLDRSKNEDLKTVKAIDLLAGIVQLTPGGNVAGSVIRSVIAAGSGDAGEAGMQMAGIVGFHWLRKADRAVDAGSSVFRNRKAGLAFERSVGITGPKRAIDLPDGRKLFPDEVTPGFLTEAKNVKRLSFTKQLRDYSAYAKANNLDFILKTPRGTKMSGPLKAAIKNGEIIHRRY